MSVITNISNKKTAVIGTGNMGGAIVGGIVKSGLVRLENLVVTDKNTESAESIANKYGIKAAQTNTEAVQNADYVILAVKPNILKSVLEEISDKIFKDTIVISNAAGKNIEFIENAIGGDKKIVRVMPNTPALYGAGMAGISVNKNVSESETEEVLSMYRSFGKAEAVPESLMDIVTGVSGSGPAYVFMFIEAMADAAVRGGMPRSQAYVFAAQTVLGSAKMVLDSGKHPGELKDMVCSPGGTTIEAVSVLEEKGMRSAVMSAIKACAEKSAKLV